LVGTDYLSVAQFDKQPEVHQILLEKGIVLLEGLNLSGVKPGIYQLICLPIKLVGTEAAPCRAVLIDNNR
jgi:arylformamidase